MNSIPYDFKNMPRIEWMGITILEPITVLTNLFITAMCLYAFSKLKHLRKINPIQNQVKYFFLLMALSTLVGGVIGHGFLYITGVYGKLPGWYISMLAVAIMERAAIKHAQPLLAAFWGKFFSVLNYVEITIFMVLSFITLNFRFIELHATYGLFVVVFSLELYIYIKKRHGAGVPLFLATGCGMIAALIHLFELGINRWINYNDVSHIAMVAAIYFYYRASRRIIIYGEEKQPEKQQPSLSVSKS